MPPKTSKRKGATGYKLPDPLPEGEILSDGKKKWRLGKSIGVGGFGEIYLCSDDIEHKVVNDATHVMKIEPSENGPLFVEMHFYVLAATPSSVEAFKKEKGLEDIGIPCFRGKGLHTFKGQKYRFLVIDRFGKDLQKIFQSGKKLFSPKAAYNLAIRIIDVLEYIHSQGYVHNDIKSQNLLLGHGRTKENDVYLVDFGLVSKYMINGVHVEYKPDARKAHDGTIEYTSRDAHIGAHSRRSDLEILGYNLVHWMSGTLPWMSNLSNPSYVHTQKKGFMAEIPKFLRNCFGEENDYPGVLKDFLTYVTKLEYDTKPDYDYCRELFRLALRKLRLPYDGKVDFSAPKVSGSKKRRKRRSSACAGIAAAATIMNAADPVDTTDFVNHRKSSRNTSSNRVNGGGAVQPTPATSPSPDTVDSGAQTRSAEAIGEKEGEWCWERILCSDPEMLIRQASRNSETEDESPLAIQRRAMEARRQKESLLNPTPAMLKIMKRLQEREAERLQMSWPQQLQHLTGKKNNAKNNKDAGTWGDLTPNPLTPAMEEVINMRSKRVSIEVDIPITPEPSDDDLDFYSSDSDSSHEEYVPPSSPEKFRQRSIPKRRSSRQASSPTPTVVATMLSSPPSSGVSQKRKNGSGEKAVDINPFLQLALNMEESAITQKNKTIVSSSASSPPKRTQSRKTASKIGAKTKVSVQNRMKTPNKIQNRGSPIKSVSVSTTTHSARRRISIQNEAELILNRKSRDKKPTMIARIATPTKRKGVKIDDFPKVEVLTRLPLRRRCRKNMPIIDDYEDKEEEFSEYPENLSEIQQSPSKPKRGKKASSAKLLSTKSKMDSKTKEEARKPQESPAMKWDKVLRTNPERLLKKKKQNDGFY